MQATIEKMDAVFECVSLLECYYTHNLNEIYADSDVIDSCEHARVNDRLSEAEYNRFFGAIKEVYSHVASAFELDDPIPKHLFTILPDHCQSLTSLAGLIFDAERLLSTQGELSKEDRRMLILANIATCDSVEAVNVEDFREYSFFSEYIRLQDIHDSLKLQLLDLGLSFDKYQASYHACIDKALKLFNEKAYLLEPLLSEFGVNMQKRLDEEGTEGILKQMFVLESDYSPMLYPSVMRFGLVIATNYRHLGVKYGSARTMTCYGIYHDEQKRRYAARKAEGEGLVDLFKALADKNKIQIMCSLRAGPKLVQELMDLTGLSKATISYHMSELMFVSLVSSQKQGNRLLYSVNADSVRQLITLIERNLLPLGE